jgi:hypothetical protein
MANEIEGTGIPFTDIHINLTDQTVVLKKEDQVVATLVFAGELPAEGVIFFPGQQHVLPASVETTSDVVEAVPQSSEPVASVSSPQEREKTITLSGKLKSKPQPGKNDRSNKPTAYADFAAHVEGEKDVHYYIATFYRHTRGIALKLPKEAQITVTGYPHPSNSARRKDEPVPKFRSQLRA